MKKSIESAYHQVIAENDHLKTQLSALEHELK